MRLARTSLCVRLTMQRLLVRVLVMLIVRVLVSIRSLVLLRRMLDLRILTLVCLVLLRLKVAPCKVRLRVMALILAVAFLLRVFRLAVVSRVTLLVSICRLVLMLALVLSRVTIVLLKLARILLLVSRLLLGIRLRLLSVNCRKRLRASSLLVKIIPRPLVIWRMVVLKFVIVRREPSLMLSRIRIETETTECHSCRFLADAFLHVPFWRVLTLYIPP